MLSTPRAVALNPARAMISEAFPRMIAGPFRFNSAATVVRNERKPTATGSSTQGRPAWFAAATAARMAAAWSCVRVPTLTSRAPAIAANCAVSSGSWIMAGAAPSASRALAV